MGLTYRQSPRPLVATTFYRRVQSEDPPVLLSGMVNVTLDQQGRLLAFRAVAPQYEDAKGPAPEPDWTPLFAAAGLDPASFKPSLPKWTEVVPTDKLVAWEGVYPEKPEVPLRVEAGSYRGRPVRFALVPPWKKPARMGAAPATRQLTLLRATWAITALAVMAGGAYLARRNIRLGRGDRSGAFKLAGFAFVLAMLRWVFWTDHAPQLGGPGQAGELQQFFEAAGQALVGGAFVWLMYMALEPYVRRRWPHMLISWNRLLAGGFRNPLVGRDVLLGSLFGLAAYFFHHLRFVAPPWFGVPGIRPLR